VFSLCRIIMHSTSDMDILFRMAFSLLRMIFFSVFFLLLVGLNLSFWVYAKFCSLATPTHCSWVVFVWVYKWVRLAKSSTLSPNKWVGLPKSSWPF
jgi:hypothetical protein